jgi:hypothetical protein
VPEPAPAKAGGAAAREWLAEREAELLPVPYYHVVFTLPARIAAIAYQNKAVIYDLLLKASSETPHHRGRSQASRRSHRHLVRPPHLGLDNDPAPACAHDRAGWRVLARRKALALMSSTLLPVSGRAVSPCSARCSWPSSAPLIRQVHCSSSAQACPTDRSASIRCLSGAVVKHKLGGLLQTPLRGPQGGLA